MFHKKKRYIRIISINKRGQLDWGGYIGAQGGTHRRPNSRRRRGGPRRASALMGYQGQGAGLNAFCVFKSRCALWMTRKHTPLQAWTSKMRGSAGGLGLWDAHRSRCRLVTRALLLSTHNFTLCSLLGELFANVYMLGGPSVRKRGGTKRVKGHCGVQGESVGMDRWAFVWQEERSM